MRKALKTVLCVALILALTAIVALRVLPPMDTPAQSAAYYREHGYSFICFSEHDYYTDLRKY